MKNNYKQEQKKTYNHCDTWHARAQTF